MANQTRSWCSCLTKHYGHCDKNNVCGIQGCTKRHHELLHKPTENAVVSITTARKVILKMMSVQIRGPKAGL
jgi:hypothetical protein